MIAYNGLEVSNFWILAVFSVPRLLGLVKLIFCRGQGVTIVAFFALPALAWAQSDPASLLRADAAPYLKLAIVANAAAQCGLRSASWNDDAHTAIDDAIDAFTVNLFGSLGTPKGQAAENDLGDAIDKSDQTAPRLDAQQCTRLADSGSVQKVDALILQDPGLGHDTATQNQTPGYAIPPGGGDTNP